MNQKNITKRTAERENRMMEKEMPNVTIRKKKKNKSRKNKNVTKRSTARKNKMMEKEMPNVTFKRTTGGKRRSRKRKTKRFFNKDGSRKNNKERSRKGKSKRRSRKRKSKRRSRKRKSKRRSRKRKSKRRSRKRKSKRRSVGGAMVDAIPDGKSFAEAKKIVGDTYKEIKENINKPLKFESDIVAVKKRLEKYIKFAKSIDYWTIQDYSTYAKSVTEDTFFRSGAYLQSLITNSKNTQPRERSVTKPVKRDIQIEQYLDNINFLNEKVEELNNKYGNIEDTVKKARKTLDAVYDEKLKALRGKKYSTSALKKAFKLAKLNVSRVKNWANDVATLNGLSSKPITKSDFREIYDAQHGKFYSFGRLMHLLELDKLGPQQVEGSKTPLDFFPKERGEILDMMKQVKNLESSSGSKISKQVNK